ncbi:glycogen debranching protein [Sulfolobus sp. A20]|uniref:amylo-alpha-1,6-glucosidase n=2 Tax=Sulfolobaceae TaxID=118883 RepID=UPI00084616C0|nr:amylo-alpha-1,6-glucosidase [Sulfolobus sp. A20]TRM73998.1 glycogen debranching protein [Sulfolobus sp. E5]TRM75294.1 glycogen debranching protein [Sulfolobus sp. A20-N-F8]TRM76309.1 glycogen debranching protein [Sulfolobus sp. B5]TRM87383.1 glycogen debranching protein [Sulfolobus sp. E3]TRM98539.1 glycogen debranching protein [Sulfolobus sp. E1]TRM99951.1 glycogen debranching protein [Sulfolobus sp. F1]
MFTVEQCEEREWIIPTRTGGYSSSTPCGINARTYHGYLIVPLNPPHLRYLVLSKFEDFIILNNEEYPLTTNHYLPDTYYPQGYKYLEKFEKGRKSVTWVYNFGYSEVKKTLLVHKGYDAITVKYTVTKGKIKICPFITFRSHHLARKSPNTFFTYDTTPSNHIHIYLEGKKILNFEIEGKYELLNTNFWYYNFLYKKDQELGNNHVEDLYNPFCIISLSNSITVNAYIGQPPKFHAITDETSEDSHDILALLSDAGKDFVIKSKDGWHIIAGYHWFDEWGRDTFVSLEGLLLLDKLYEIAENIILRYLELMDKGMLPNHFISYNSEPVYKGVDISLLAVNAIYKTYIYSKDKTFLQKVYPKVLEIIDWYSKGNGIVYNVDGLIFHRGAPRTWMDASYDTVIVTPREGAAVEINALWYNAIKIAEFFSRELDERADDLSEKAEKIKKSFIEKFKADKGLYDYIDWDFKPNLSIRPNQIFAISLPFPVINENDSYFKEILSLIENKLLRPYGLSTLARDDPNYIPVYKGDRWSRDRAYHNGPIWPWLLGQYIDAKVRVEKNPIEIKLLFEQFRPLINYALDNQGFIPEIFEDIPPYRPRGCIAQAWSNAEVYKMLVKIANI